MNKKLSVLITNWNTYVPLVEKIEIIRNDLQGWLDYEILVFDQGSTDKSCPWLESQRDLQVHFEPTNIGQSKSRNWLVNNSTGKYVLFLDGDITPIPGSITAMLQYMEMHHSRGVAYDIKGDTHYKEEATPAENNLCGEFLSSSEFLYFHYAMYRRDVIVKHPLPEFSPFDTAGWGVEEDVARLLDPSFSISVIKNRKFYHHRDGHSKNFIGSDWTASRAKRQAMLAYLQHMSPKVLKACYGGPAHEILNLRAPRLSVYDSVDCIVTDAAFAALTNYFPFGLAPDQEHPPLIFSHDATVVDIQELDIHSTGRVSVPARYSPLWLIANDRAPIYDAQGHTLIVTDTTECYSYDACRDNLTMTSGVDTTHPWIVILTALLGFPARLGVDDISAVELLQDHGLNPVVSREQALAFRQLHQNTGAQNVIFPLTQMLMNHHITKAHE